MNTERFNVASSLKIQVVSWCETYYGNNYCFTVMYSCCMLWFRCVIHHVGDVFLIILDNTCGGVRTFGNNYIRVCTKFRCID